MQIFKNKLKLPDLIDFVKPYALPADKAKEDRVIDSTTKETINKKEGEVGFAFVENLDGLASKVFSSHKAGLCLFIDKTQPSADRYMELLSLIAQEVGDYINVVVF